MSQHSREEGQERAALYAVGALLDEERTAFEAHLDAGCAVCREEIDAMTAVGAQLGQLVSTQRPRPEIRSAVLAAAAECTEFSEHGIHFVRGNRIDWQAGRGPKLQVKPLFTDRERGYRTSLIRMEPGATYPAHRHADLEELYVLEGEVTISGVVMRAGDYCRAEPQTLHTGISTRDGCVFIAMYSEHNQLLA